MSNTSITTIGAIAIARWVIAICVALPATLLAPFAIWLAIASVMQFVYTGNALSVIVLVVCIAGLVGVGAVWSFVIFGPLSRYLGVAQVLGISLGFLALAIVVCLQTLASVQR